MGQPTNLQNTGEFLMETFLLYLKSVIIGIVEGITEFIPVSSTGHMIIAGQFIDFNKNSGYTPGFVELFEVVIQLGAILAVIVLYRKKIWRSLKTLKPGGFGFKLWIGLIIAMIPAGIVAIIDKKILDDPISKVMMSPLPVAIALVVGAAWMLFAEWRYRKNDTCSKLENVTYKQAFAIGIFQCIAMVWPGFSRSASTIIGGWIMGLATPVAAEFSFFLAIPAMIAASGADLITSKAQLTGSEIGALIVGFIVAFIVALFVVKKFIEFLKNKPMKNFAIYRLIVGSILIVLALFGVINGAAI